MAYIEREDLITESNNMASDLIKDNSIQCNIAAEEAIIDIRENIQPIIGGKSLDIAISALEKQIPKKVEVTKYDIGGNNYFCSCGNKLRNGSEYCDKCGCKLDWSDTE